MAQIMQLKAGAKRMFIILRACKNKLVESDKS